VISPCHERLWLQQVLFLVMILFWRRYSYSIPFYLSMKTNNIHVFAPFDLVEHSIFYEKVRNVTALDSAALSLSLLYE
jgi:hypothetical protein